LREFSPRRATYERRAFGAKQILNRRLLKVGDFKSPFLVLRHPRTKNHARVFKILGMKR
jgi:hypothetical protein